MQKDFYNGQAGGPLAGLIIDEQGWRVALMPAPQKEQSSSLDDDERFAEEDHGFQEHGYEDHELTDEDLD